MTILFWLALATLILTIVASFDLVIAAAASARCWRTIGSKRL